MPVRLRRLSRDERGTTLIELVVTMASGLVIFLAISTVIIVSLRATGRASARVDAVQRARVTLAKVVDQLHSACIAPQIAPVRAGSSETSLSFVHQTGSAVSPTPVLSTISLSGSTLSQSDYAWVSGTVPNWVFSSAASSTRQLMTKISPTSPNTGIFRYYAYTNGQVSGTPLPAASLSAEDAARTVKVQIAFTAAPLSTPVKDAKASANVQSSVVLRLTPASFNSNVVNLPCQ